jgi:signal transduction histidine kinase
MRLQLREQFDRGSRFLMGISHDLKTPLSSITGYIDAITDGYADSPDKLHKYTSIIRTKTQLLESRISALIDYAKQETRDRKKTLQDVPLASFLREFTSLVEAEAHARQFTFTESIALADELLVAMDPDMVNRALENLVENAFHYADPGSEIQIRANISKNQVAIEVVNSGPGINADDLPHIFDPLYRAAADRPSNGFGLGLATVRSVITSHGWDISVESEPGRTTVFTVVVPFTDAARTR